MTIDVFVFRGAGEAQGPPVLPLPPGRTTQLCEPSGLLTSITDNLDSDKYTCYEVAWPASVGPFPGGDLGAPSLETSVAMGVAAAAQAIIETPNVAGLISYSLGGICASRLLEEVHAGKHKNVDGSDLEIDFVVNIANPMRRDGESVNGLCGSGSFGLHGQRGDWPELDVREYANPGSFALGKIEDIITNSPADSPLRLINDGVSPFSFIEGARLGNVGNVLFDQLIAFLHSDPPHNFERFHRAFIGVLSYLEPPPNGAHVCYPFVNMLGQSETWTNHAVGYLNNR